MATVAVEQAYHDYFLLPGPFRTKGFFRVVLSDNTDELVCYHEPVRTNTGRVTWYEHDQDLLEKYYLAGKCQVAMARIVFEPFDPDKLE